jgi:hypothetical protein
MKQKIIKPKSKKNYEYNINRAFLGIFTIAIGAIILMNNLDIYPFSFDIAVLWPLFIVFVGLSLFKKKNIISTAVGSVITIVCAVLFFSSVASYTINSFHFVYQNNITPISIAKDVNLEKAEIELNVGPGRINVYGVNSDKLIEGKLLTNIMKSEINQSITGTTQKVSISLLGKNGLMKENVLESQFNIGVDENTPLDFVFNSGGSNNNVDLSEIKAENIKISTGASSLFLKLGDSINSNVVIEAGASSLNLDLPEDAGVQIKIESGSSSQELPGFSLVNDDTYQSLNYSSKERKINIEITMGMASLKINWYSPIKKNEINLFYYNQSEDKENTCDADYILPVKRYVPESENQIKDVIELLIKGNLTEKEKEQGFVTEFPNEDFKLLSSGIEDGVLTLEFSEVPGFTAGGSCRVGILASEIIKTAKQFPEVKKVVFEPESLFEP